MSNTKTLMKFIAYLVKCSIRCLLELASFLSTALSQPRRPTLPVIDDKILVTPAIELSKKIKSGELTSEQVVEAYISRIKKVNPIINAVVDKHFDKALDEARRLDKKLLEARSGIGDESLLNLPLVGVPLTVKETISLEGSAFTAGLVSRKSRRARQSNTAVQQLKNSGLIPIGTTNTPCMCLWWDSSNFVYGRTENPYDLSRIVGGSSGGEGAIVGAAGSVVGVGSDLGGSIRIPANFCGVFGHKPTPFTVPTDCLYPKFRKEQQALLGVGPITRYACDLLPMLKIMCHQEEVAKMKLDEPVDIKKIKIYFIEDLGDPLASKCTPDIIAGLRDAVKHLNSTFHTTAESVKLDEFKYGMALWGSELESSGGHVYDTEDEEYGLEPIQALVELAKRIVNKSEYPFTTIATNILDKTVGPKYGTPLHRVLTKKAVQLRERFYTMVGDDGVLLMPTHPEPAPHHHSTIFKILNVSYTSVVNCLQAPVTQCPVGMSKDGLPYGLQVIAKPYNDRLTLAVAQELERAFGGWLAPSRVTA